MPETGAPKLRFPFVILILAGAAVFGGYLFFSGQNSPPAPGLNPPELRQPALKNAKTDTATPPKQGYAVPDFIKPEALREMAGKRPAAAPAADRLEEDLVDSDDEAQPVDHDSDFIKEIEPYRGDKGELTPVELAGLVLDPFMPEVETDVLILEHKVAAIENRVEHSSSTLVELKEKNFPEYVAYVKRLQSAAKQSEKPSV